MGGDLKVYGTNSGRQSRDVKKITAHSAYNSDKNNIPQNDVALIILAQPFTLSSTFSPVNITDNGTVDDEPCRVGK